MNVFYLLLTFDLANIDCMVFVLTKSDEDLSLHFFFCLAHSHSIMLRTYHIHVGKTDAAFFFSLN